MACNEILAELGEECLSDASSDESLGVKLDLIE